MATFANDRPSWGRSFVIDDGGGDGRIRLAQRGRVQFALESTVRFTGITGLEHLNLPAAAEERLRHVTPEDLPETDLASIPPPMRWWVNTYGAHTPAALIHDFFIGGTLPDGVTAQHIDRYFRFMLDDVGIRLVKRWIMWAAVALRTRWAAAGIRRVSLIVWFLCALFGIGASVVAGFDHNWAALAITFVVMPLVASLLWERQWGAAVIAAYVVFPLLILPMAVSIVCLLPFVVVERAVSALPGPRFDGTEPAWEVVSDPDDPSR